MTETSQPISQRAPSLSALLDAVRDLGEERDTVTFADVMQALGRASTTALLFIPGIVATSPLSGIPGLSTFCGIIITLVSAQALLGRRSLWLPGFVTRRRLEGTRIRDALAKVRGITAFLDRHTHQRLDVLVRPPGDKVLLAICMLCGMIMPFLELIPFSASVAAACVTLLSVAILTLDGLLAAVALGFLATAAGLIVWLL
ncbi:hypothetical protein P775_14010 [Puniceibacterium antarcticum]|uniref:Exopolysaccharide biosynthesis protein n=1 Tax=Puniceibacterium antarcticum TaxID=1206336 RepID=A0A2G8RDI2_9RHOB|nr:exopolysaccharide biosynthesis protein [Puniceibacterium antarcticum]PIL19635.1 hypothetical protein P775_14010 [Puniceibacterium antarcticum]